MGRVLCLLMVLVVTACADRGSTPVVPEALKLGKPISILVATSRASDADGSFGSARSESLAFLDMIVSVPPRHVAGTLEFARAKPNPETQFVLAAQERIATPSQFAERLGADLRSRPAAEREVAVFVHGFNSTNDEAAFRSAQLVNDIGLPARLVLYSWPSRGKALAYGYDNDSVLFARDGLEQLLRLVARTGATRILLFAHSMGGALTMETLRQIDAKDPGWVGRKIGGVILVSPDLDVDVFRSQMNALTRIPDPFVIFVSRRDRILDISARLRGANERVRLGNIRDISEISNLPVDIVDTSAFAGDAGSAHFTPATSPALISMLRRARSVNDMLGTDEITLSSVLTGRQSSGPSAIEIILKPDGAPER